MNNKIQFSTTDSSSYREPLCVSDNKGYPLFSPLCNPDYVSQQVIDSGSYKERIGYNDSECKITPLVAPKAQVKQYDDKPSAFDWFKDPTYSERVKIRKLGLDDVALDKNPSVLMYHQLKTMEKAGGSLLQTL